jgi:PPK2 family polyphosphate:nucleotide phosphotransferase
MSSVVSPYLVPFDSSFTVADASTAPPSDVPDKGDLKDELKDHVEAIRGLQRRLYAEDSRAVLLIFQAMDAAGKDGTIRAVMSGINPAGCQVFSFKAPSNEERDHDFLWRTAVRLPERGRLGIFNRSYYEEVLVVRVHPHLLAGQQLPDRPLAQLWPERLESIADHERHLTRNGTTIIKFWLNVSEDEQRKRLLKRLDDPDRNWKFSSRDVDEREHWPKYMDSYQDALRATSKPWAPWYAIPADNKPFMRTAVADILRRTLEGMDPQFPTVSDKVRDELMESRKRLLD